MRAAAAFLNFVCETERILPVMESSSFLQNICSPCIVIITLEQMFVKRF